LAHPVCGREIRHHFHTPKSVLTKIFVEIGMEMGMKLLGRGDGKNPRE